MKQMKDKHYADEYKNMNKNIYYVAVNIKHTFIKTDKGRK